MWTQSFADTEQQVVISNVFFQCGYHQARIIIHIELQVSREYGEYAVKTMEGYSMLQHSNEGKTLWQSCWNKV